MPADYETLLAIQDLDTTADVLRHRREVLPERVELNARNDALAALEADLAPTREERHRVERAQKALEDEISALAEKRSSVEAQMYGGGSSNAKELQSLQDEIDSIDRRRSRLEDEVLERMVEAEPLDSALAVSLEQRSGLDDEAVALVARVTEAEATIDAELAELETRRAPLVATVDPDALARYERLRARLKGVGIARLDGTRCTGCHLALPAAEVEAVRRQARDEGVAECPECDRLLVV
jgi:predicted  nucleic acid-binding Zn-ribbon protein